MSDLTDSLDALMDQHRRIGSPVPSYLRRGLPADRIQRRIVDAVGVDAHSGLVELFAWHDGIDNDRWERDGAGNGFARLFGDTHFAPLADAIGSYRESIETDATTARYAGGEAPETWGPSWFPAFCQGWDVYGVECRTGPDWGRVYLPSWEPPTAVGPGPRFRDLQHLVDSAIRRFRLDGYWWNTSEGFLEERLEILDPLYEQEITEARS